MNKQKFKEAANAGIISHQQAEQLADFFNTKSSVAEQTPVEDSVSVASTRGEQLKFMRSFGDIFITLGIILFALTSNQLLENMTHQIILIAVFIGLSEWLVRLKRLVLPGISILISLLYFTHNLFTHNLFTQDLIGSFSVSSDLVGETVVIVTSLLFYLRYKMPFSLYPLAVAISYALVQLLGINLLDKSYIFILLGLVIFVFAMWYDSRDTERVSSLSDNGFWLHLLAAPLIVHGVMATIFLSNVGELEVYEYSSVIILLVFIVFFFVALFVDRRAILVSSFAYAIFAISKFAFEYLYHIQNLSLFIFMGIGIFVIFFGTYWYKVRQIIYSPMANSKLSKLVPDFKERI